MVLMNKFKIEHIDPLGQGVFKNKDEIYFIPKTLPSEEGHFEILQRKKGVHFAQVTQLTYASPNRIEPDCFHYNQCPGCHFLHTDYQTELDIKKATFERWLQNFDHPKVEIMQSLKRLHYRNRIQLHYEGELIGLVDARKRSIVPISKCQIMLPELKEAFDKFLGNWKTIRKKQQQPKKGHVELYFINDEVKISWNQRYAAGGFTQVHGALNEQIKDWIKLNYDNRQNGLLELFGGDGNLSSKLSFDYRVCVDLYPESSLGKVSLNLFEEEALKEFISKDDRIFKTLFIDPPRSGHKQLNSWVEHYKPDQILYMSCNPVTQINDIKPILEEYEIKSVLLIDLFASTYHFESIIAMQRKETGF